jgi:putative MATE family efflux protein
MVGIKQIQSGEPLNRRQCLKLAAKLSWPAMMAQLSSIIMQYIDTAMVGQLGADDSASIGLMNSSLWLFWGLCSSATVGFSVQVAHRIGAADAKGARMVLRQAIGTCLCIGLTVALIGASIAFELPGWLGGAPEVRANASIYFLVFVLALPILIFNYLGSGILRASGNMKVPGGLNVLMCVLDVIFNFVLIFPTRTIAFFNTELTIPGAGLGVLGAALGTVIAEVIISSIVMWYLCCKQDGMKIFYTGEHGSYRPGGQILRNAIKVSTPVAIEHAVISGAQIVITLIVAPLGVIAIAANAFAVTAESLCYMPGFGIGDAATTLVGQSYGAKRLDLAKRLGYVTVGMGMAVMTVMGAILYVTAPYVMGMLSPVTDICNLGTEVLRIEAWAEPMYAASIVAYGAMVGVGDTVVPACMNFVSIWIVRLPIAAILARTIGLRGVWLAMCIELTFRGLIFLYRLIRGHWLRHGLHPA